MKYEIRATVVANDIDGTIRMGKNDFRLSAKRAKWRLKKKNSLSRLSGPRLFAKGGKD